MTCTPFLREIPAQSSQAMTSSNGTKCAGVNGITMVNVADDYETNVNNNNTGQ